MRLGDVVKIYSYSFLNDDGVLVQAASMDARDDLTAMQLSKRLEASDAVWLSISQAGRAVYQGRIDVAFPDTKFVPTEPTHSDLFSR
jgi:hypothetical protein